MSNLSELLPAGGSAKEFEAVASGTLPNGRAVVLKANGQVEVAGIATVAADIPYGSETTFGTNRAQYVSPAAFDPNTVGKFVIAYQDRDISSSNSKYPVAIVGQVSGASISFGTPYIINSEVSSFTTVAFDPNNANKILTAFRGGSSNHGKARVGTISGTSISFGSLVTFNTGTTNYISIAFDPNTSNKLVISFADSSSSNSKAFVGTISGTSVSFGSAAVFDSEPVPIHSLVFDPNIANKFVLCYRDSSWYGHVKIGTVSGTSISYGSVNTFHSASTIVGELAFDPNTANKFVIVYCNDAASTKDGTAIVGTISGSSISYGTAVIYNSSEISQNSISFDPNTANTFVVAYYRNNGLTGRANIGTISGTSLSFSSHYIFNPSLTGYLGVRFDPNAVGQFVLTYVDGSKAYALTGISTHQGTNLTSTNFVGTSTAAFTNGQTATIVPKGGVAASVSNIAIPTSIPDGSSVTYTSARAENNTVAFDPSDSTKFVVAYRDNGSGEGRAVVGSVSGTSISFGTTVKFADGGAQMDANAISFDPNQTGRFVIAHNATVGGATKGMATVGTISGTSITFETSVQMFNGSMVLVSCEFDPQVSGKFLLNWGDSANNLLVGTLAGTSLSFGTLVTLSGTYNQPNLAVDPINAGKYVISYQDGADSDHGYAAVVTVAGTTPSRGTPVKFLSAACESPHVVYDSGVSNSFVIAFVDAGDSRKAKAVAGVVAGTSLSFGSTINYNATSTASTYIAADPNTTGSFVAISDDGTALVTIITRSGTNTVTAGTSHVIYNAANENGAIEFNPSNSKKGQFVFVTEDRSASPYKGTSVLGQTPSTGSVLTIGSTYYVQSDGTVSTASTSPAVNAGKAVSSTSLILKGNS